MREKTHMGTSTNNDVQQAAAEAADLLRVHADSPAIAAVLTTLTTIEDEGEGLEKALDDIQVARVAFQKSAGREDQHLIERLAKSERVLRHEMMMKRSGGYRRAQENRQVEEARRAASLAGRGAA
jgi:hypothetical protein